jgi:hypothetical protein
LSQSTGGAIEAHADQLYWRLTHDWKSSNRRHACLWHAFTVPSGQPPGRQLTGPKRARRCTAWQRSRSSERPKSVQDEAVLLRCDGVENGGGEDHLTSPLIADATHRPRRPAQRRHDATVGFDLTERRVPGTEGQVAAEDEFAAPTKRRSRRVLGPKHYDAGVGVIGERSEHVARKRRCYAAPGPFRAGEPVQWDEPPSAAGAQITTASAS